MYAQIAVNMPVEGTFHYHIPPDLVGRLEPGHLVEVPFGQQKAQGIIIRLETDSPVSATRPISDLIDREPVVSPAQIGLAYWLSERYLTPVSQCILLFLPPGLARRGDVLITPVIDPRAIEARSETQQRLLNLLHQHGPLRGRQIAQALPRRNWQSAVADLVGRGLVLREPVLDAPAASGKAVRRAELAVPPEQLEAVIAGRFNPAALPANRQPAAVRRASILRVLAREQGSLEVGRLYASVPGSSLADLRALEADDLIALRQDSIWRDPLGGMAFVPDTPPQLTADQAAAWDVIRAALEPRSGARPVLVHGVTGSGKTELYLRAVERVLAQGRSALVLVPEIALTPQTVRRFGARFAGRMGLIHSRLSPGERYDTWRRARSGQFDVIVGPRSALFSPLHNLGVIVIDECHDDSYKQSPPVPPPYYHTIPTAIEMARRQGALVLMGSATPNVAAYAQAVPREAGIEAEYQLVELPARIMGHRRAIEMQAVHFQISQTRYRHDPGSPDEAVMIDLPPVRIVDMRQELRANNRSIFSRMLTRALEQTLSRGEQAILFLNRRGTSTFVFCRSCGHVLMCPHCEIPLTWHAGSAAGQGILVCHHCNRRSGSPAACPQCGSEQIRYFGGGTERVEEEVLRRFPGVRTVRWDRDTTGGKGSHDTLLRQFIEREASILIGTQMVAKGLDLPLVTLVGVISADTALYLPDFRSGERTFQLLTQVAGRAGRGLLGGEVILQTYNPDHYAIQAAANHDFHAFYQQEMAYRRELAYPPYRQLVRLLIRAESAESAREQAESLKQDLSRLIADEHLVNTSLIGPAPAFYPRQGGLYHWHVIIRSPDPRPLLGILHPSPRLHIDIDPVSLL